MIRIKTSGEAKDNILPYQLVMFGKGSCHSGVACCGQLKTTETQHCSGPRGWDRGMKGIREPGLKGRGNEGSAADGPCDLNSECKQNL
jgi:hypothetical protein